MPSIMAHKIHKDSASGKLLVTQPGDDKLVTAGVATPGQFAFCGGMAKDPTEEIFSKAVSARAITVDRYGDIYYANGSGVLTKVDADGRVLWTFDAGLQLNDVSCEGWSPYVCVAGQRGAYEGSDRCFWVVDRKSGDLVWSGDTGGHAYGCWCDDTVVVICGQRVEYPHQETGEEYDYELIGEASCWTFHHNQKMVEGTYGGGIEGYYDSGADMQDVTCWSRNQTRYACGAGDRNMAWAGGDEATNASFWIFRAEAASQHLNEYDTGADANCVSIYYRYGNYEILFAVGGSRVDSKSFFLMEISAYNSYAGYISVNNYDTGGDVYDIDATLPGSVTVCGQRASGANYRVYAASPARTRSRPDPWDYLVEEYTELMLALDVSGTAAACAAYPRQGVWMRWYHPQPLVATDSKIVLHAGLLMWYAFFNYILGGTGVANRIAVCMSADKVFWFMRYETSGDDDRAYVLCYEKTGKPVYETDLGVVHGMTTGGRIHRDGDDNIYVVIKRTDSSAYWNLIKVNSLGLEDFDEQIGPGTGETENWIHDFGISLDAGGQAAGFFLAGVWSQGGGYDDYIFGCNGAGEQQWQTVLSDDIDRVCVTGSGYYGLDNSDLNEYDSGGLDHSVVSSGGDQVFNCVSQDSSGNFIIGSNWTAFGSGDNVEKYNTSGTKLWGVTLGPSGDGSDGVQWLGNDSDDNIYAVVSADIDSRTESWLYILNSSGTVQYSCNFWDYEISRSCGPGGYA